MREHRHCGCGRVAMEWAVEANLRLQAENAALKAEARYKREIAEAGADAKPLIVAHNLQLMAENESLTRKLDERDDTIKRMAEGEDDNWAEMKRLEAKNDKLQSENAVLRRSNVALLQADTCRRRDLAVCEADVLALRKVNEELKASRHEWAVAEMARTAEASTQRMFGEACDRALSSHINASNGKLRAYVREHGPCEFCTLVDCGPAGRGCCPMHKEWLLIQEV